MLNSFIVQSFLGDQYTHRTELYRSLYSSYRVVSLLLSKKSFVSLVKKYNNAETQP